MNSIYAFEVAQRDLHGITIRDFHKKMSELETVEPYDRMHLFKEHSKDSPRYAYGEYYGMYELSNGKGFERQRLIQEKRDAFIKKHVRSFSSVTFS